jgi:hypothetical protein
LKNRGLIWHGGANLADVRSDKLKRSPGLRFRLPAMIAAMTLLALLAALAGPFFRQQTAVAQRSLLAYWLVTIAVAIGAFAWRWRRMTTPNPLMGMAYWQVTLVRRSWRRDVAVRAGIIVFLAFWLAWEAMQFVRIHDRFAQGLVSRTFAVAVRGSVIGWLIGLGLAPRLLKRPAFICQRGLWTFGKPEAFWSKLTAWQWLSDRPGVMKLSETKTSGRSRELFVAIPAELRLAVEDYVREKTELTIPDPQARFSVVDDAADDEGEAV